MELNRMQSNSAIGSFLDEVTKWQKRLHLIEAVLDAWMTVQIKWVQLDEVYSGADVRTALAHEANMFAVMSKDFRLLMRATEKNTNVLQSCSRKGLLPMLEKMDIKMEQCRHALLGNLERRRQRFPRFYFLSPEDVMNIVCYGYDLNAVNKYLCKIFPHLGQLVFEEEQVVSQNLSPSRHASAGGKKKFRVTAVMSTSGEALNLQKSLIYEGPMSLWLPQLLASIQVTLQEQLHVALGNSSRPAQIEQTLRSAGASKILISRPSSAVSQRSGGSHDIPKVNVTPPQTDVESGRSEPLAAVMEKRSEMADQLSVALSASVPSQHVSWTLDNPTQVVLLATMVQMNEKLTGAMTATESGDQMAMTKVADAISDNLHAAVIMLKGIEDEKAVRMKSARRRSKKKEKQDDRNDESDASESIGAPSTRSSLDDEFYAEEDFNDDAMGQDSGRGPIETMQSLLFTDQVRSGSRGTRGELDQLSQKQEETGESTNESDSKILLFPSQVQKISGLISILTQQRDVYASLQEAMKHSSKTELDKVFEWQARLKHVYDKEEMLVSVHAMDWKFEYGYEYQGSCSRYVVSPSSDRILLSMCHALKSNMGVALTPSSHQMLSELSYQLGRALYSVLCTQAVDHFMLGDLFKGIAETGCWICLQNLDTLKPSVLSVTGQLAAEVHRALIASKPSIILMSEEVSLSPHAACFVTLCGSKKHTQGLNESVLSAAIQLPEECRSNFRVINGVVPDRKAVFEIQLLAQGFTQAGQLARKLCIFLDLCGSLISTLSHSSISASEIAIPKGSPPNVAYLDNVSTSVPLMDHVISGSGSVLDNLMREQLDLKQEYRDTIAAKTQKFANIWQHRSSLMSSSGGLASSVNEDSEKEGGPGGIFSSSSIAPLVDPATQEVIQVNKDREVIESDVETMRKMEEVAIATALRNVLCPRLPVKEDRSLMATFVVDLWPDADVDFDLEESEEMNVKTSIPSGPIDSESTPYQTNKPDPEPVGEMEAAIAAATKECFLSHSIPFQSRVSQLYQLMESMRSVIVYGSAGVGKSKCIDVFTQTHKHLGCDVTCKKIYVNALDSRRKLFGYFETDNREWRDGLIQALLRPHCLGQDATDETPNPARSSIFLLHVDGKMRPEDADVFVQLLRTESIGSSWLSLPNNERLCIPFDVRVAWELEDLSSLAPNVPPQLALVAFTGTEVTWNTILTHWTENLSRVARAATQNIVMRYLPKLVDYFVRNTTPAHLVTSDDVGMRLRQTTRVSSAAMTRTFCLLVDCLLPQQGDVTVSERERYIGYAAFWAFGGTLEADSRSAFAIWCCDSWPNLFPSGTSEPWRLFIEPESRSFARWDDHMPQFSGFNGVSSAFVHTPDASQLMHLVGALMDAGHPSVIVGPLGCGKSAVLRERVNNVSSGEVAEVLSLFVHCNRLTEAGTLWSRVSEHLEWKHGVTYTPRGNKKLLCMVDDVNLSRPLGEEKEECGLQSACELIRQHLDAGGVRNPLTYKWQQVSNTTYVTTVNPGPTGTSCKMTQRMTRHFSVFSCPYPHVATQHGIFSTMLHSHFLPNANTSPGTSNAGESSVENERLLKNLLSDLTMVTVELQERLRHMYLPVPTRAHYHFALCDLERIFRNLMLSLAPGCHQRDLLLLWRHECDWTYGRRMVSDVDRERYRHALDTSVRKYLTENKYLPVVLANKQPPFSSVRELDSGLVTAGKHVGRNSSNMQNSEVGNSAQVTDYYKPVTNQAALHDLLMEALKEYNKVNVQMRLSLYEDTISLICRLARIVQSPHHTAHTLLFGEGCPVLASLMVRLASHLGGFKVISLPPMISPVSVDAQTSSSSSSSGSGPTSLPEEERICLSHFKKNLVQLYNQAGVKGEKVVFMMHDDKSLTNECLTMVDEFVRHGAISHLFTPDEQTTIANSVRSDVTAAGLTYSRDVAWNFFLGTVTKNLRVVVICSKTGRPFMAQSLEFPSLFNRMNAITLHHWNHEELVANALYHFGKQDLNGEDADSAENKSVRGHWIMDRRRQENVAHLLANIHTAVKMKDNDKFYKIPGHVSNYAYEKLVERFLHLYRDRRQAVKKSHFATRGALENIDRENAIAEALQKDLDREKQVLAEHKAGTLQLLAQIGQDMVITEQQVSAVRRQIKKIRYLKKTLPEYQLAHEKAVFKAAAIVADTKKVVKEIDVQELSELRSLQKPDAEVEDLMAAIIMILKSPNSDVTWSKGAKRQMANLDRFLDELSSFDEMPMPLSTLETLESFWEKENFTPENLTTKAGGNTAAGSLLKWVQGVVRYHTTMINKVKPLRAKVQETSSSIGDAQHKLRQLESKKDALEARLRDLADGFEQATADKNSQEEKRKEMEEHLRVAAKFRQVLAGEHQRCCAVLKCFGERLEWVVGAATMAAGFATYLAPYPFMFRRMMVTVDWALCLIEKGIPLVFDSIDPVKGHAIDFMVDVNEPVLETSPRNVTEGDTVLDAIVEAGRVEEEEEQPNSIIQSDTMETEEPTNVPNHLPPLTEEADADDEHDDVITEGRDETENNGSQDLVQPEVETTISQAASFTPYTAATLPYMSNDEYQKLVSAIAKILAGEETIQDWMTKDFAQHQLHNAAVMVSSWQRPPLLLDPYLAGVDWCAVHLRNNRSITPVNLSAKIETSQVTAIEKAVLGGHTLMLMDCEHQTGPLVRPLIHHANTSGWRDERSSDENMTIRFLGRRLLCPDTFRLYLTTTQMTAAKLHPDIVAATQLISFLPSTESLQEDLLLRALQRVRPDIYRERLRVARSLRQHRHTLAQLEAILCERLVTGDDPKAIENSTKFLSNVVELKASVSAKLRHCEGLFASLTNLTEELFPIAQRAALLYSICRAIPALNIHYQIPLPYFLHLFDSSVGCEYESDDEETKVLGNVEVVHPTDAEEQQIQNMQKRKASLRLGSAKKSIRGIENIEATPEESEEQSDDQNEPIPTEEPTQDSEDDANSEPGSYVAVPEMTELPTLDYETFSSEKVKEIVDDLSRRVFAGIYGSIFPEHRLHVTALTLLNILSEEADDPFLEEELVLLIHGNPGFGRPLKISLLDFECNAPVPDWMPADRWEDLLAFSILPSTMEGVCVRVAESSDLWKIWYESKEPELEEFPLQQEETSDLSDFQRLLLIRTLRPDRYEPALQLYVDQHIKDYPLSEVVGKRCVIEAESLFKDVSNTLGILVLMPESTVETMSQIAIHPADAIKKLADKYKVTVESVTLGDGYRQEATRCIDTALSQDSWALVEGLHLAPDKFFEDLQMQLARVGNISRKDDANNTASVSSQGGHFQVWLTSKPCDGLPPLLTQYLYKISWDSLLRLIEEDSGAVQLPPSDRSIFTSCLVSVISKVSDHILAQWAGSNDRRAMNTIYIVHSMMVARNCFGWHGNNRVHALQDSTLSHALEYALTENMNISLLKSIYLDVIETDSDKMYFEHLFHDVTRHMESSKGQIFLPKTVPPAGYAEWLCSNSNPDDFSEISLLSVPSVATAWRTTEASTKLLGVMQDLFNAVQLPGYESSLLSPGNRSDVIKSHMTLAGLQSVLDMCSEKLPPLLELGGLLGNRLTEYDFPYHRPSVLSSGNPEIVHMPESIGFVLLQECIWFNQCLCKIYQQIHALRLQLFVISDYRLSEELTVTAKALSAEEVPQSWQHLDEHPNTHVLLTWLDDVMKRYAQMRTWIKSGMVPLEGRTPVGDLSSVWLGGFANPGALLTALCQEKAVLHDVTLDQVKLSCSLPLNGQDMVEQEAAIYLEDIHLVNAKWDPEKGVAIEDGEVILPIVYFYPSLISEDDKSDLVEYPVYMNMSRQRLVCHFPMSSSDIHRYSRSDSGLIRASDCYLTLQSAPDLTKREGCKSRSYLALKRREEWSHVSPAVSEMMSRSGTRMSSHPSGPRMSACSYPDQKASSVIKDPSPPPPSEFQQNLSEKSMSEKSLASHASSHVTSGSRQPQEPPQPPPQAQADRLPNGNIAQTAREPAPQASVDSLSPRSLEQGPASESARSLTDDEEGRTAGLQEGGLLQAILDEESADDRSFSSYNTGQ
ncbi:unnamed protein product [Clavelina lepadiformis]|uniref:Dynein heavy chain n=2 Tax=Clavelina lepadiformis TaxID=159417 RepID=A0ABP0GSP0_CLALP